MCGKTNPNLRGTSSLPTAARSALGALTGAAPAGYEDNIALCSFLRISGASAATHCAGRVC